MSTRKKRPPQQHLAVSITARTNTGWCEIHPTFLRAYSCDRSSVVITVNPKPFEPNPWRRFWALTRSTMEVAHFRYFVSERRGPLTQNRLSANLDFEKNVLSTRAMEFFAAMQFYSCGSKCSGEVWSSLREEPQKS